MIYISFSDQNSMCGVVEPLLHVGYAKEIFLEPSSSFPYKTVFCTGSFFRTESRLGYYSSRFTAFRLYRAAVRERGTDAGSAPV